MKIDVASGRTADYDYLVGKKSFYKHGYVPWFF